ncbi:hypothetical protein ACFPN0_13605 [Kitasatospora cinereorecta]
MVGRARYLGRGSRPLVARGPPSPRRNGDAPGPAGFLGLPGGSAGRRPARVPEAYDTAYGYVRAGARAAAVASRISRIRGWWRPA